MKPILFNTSMVHAILDNRKTMTRRVIKPQPNNEQRIEYCEPRKEWTFMRGWALVDRIIRSPYQKGDILYVRETWQHGLNGTYLYKAYAKLDLFVNPEGKLVSYIPWRPSIHMPREAARIFLRVTDVRVERLQDISSEDIEREGIDLTDLHGLGCITRCEYTYAFQSHWDSTIKNNDCALYGWDANPWVWVIEFERISREEAIGK